MVLDSLVVYAREIHTVARVTPKQEKQLGTKAQEAVRLRAGPPRVAEACFRRSPESLRSTGRY